VRPHRKECNRQLDESGDNCPNGHDLISFDRLSEHEAKSENPYVNVASATDEPDKAIEVAEIFERSTARADHS